MNESNLEDEFRKQLSGTLASHDNPDLTKLNEFALQLNELRATMKMSIPANRVVRIATEVAEAYKGKLDIGTTVRNESTFEPWLDDRKRDVELKRGDAYNQLLIDRGLGKGVVRSLSRQTDTIVELMGDPKDETSWQRKGLVIGEVQSGKTATYIGVLNKALDLGYQIVIVIGGHTEDLRRQTQERLDSDLIGFDTSYLSETAAKHNDTKIGIGKINADSGTTALTSARFDFNLKTAQSTTVNLATGNPTVFVVKKNSTVLKSLARYIRSTAPDGQHSVPIAVIDDESDWASVNTSAKDKERTAVNKAIIDLLSVSRRSSYMGITATPFANVLIADDEEAKDLFPGDYIMALESPSSYRGVDFYFSEDGGRTPNVISKVNDFHAMLPQKHKKDAPVHRLAPSLEEAILTFYLATAVRYQREGAQPPSSMMVNVSRFNNVQEKFSTLIQHYIDQVNEELFSSAAYFSGEDERPTRIVRRLSEISAAHFPGLDIKVESLGYELQRVAEDVHTELVNGLTMKERNDRLSGFSRKRLAEWKKRPVIFVGGNVLARGLTLDGLVVSYFTRKAGAADTLLQMGRWFGHRPGYDDLTRVWMDAEVVDHFSYVAGVSQDLRSSVAEMRDLNLTPKEFGLKIRLHPESSFLITAANKQRAGVKHDSPGVFSYRGKAFETHTLPGNQEATERNRSAVARFVDALTTQVKNEPEGSDHSRNLYWRNVPHELVQEFLSGFTLNRNLPTSKVFGIGDLLPGGIAAVGQRYGWTVGLMSGRGPAKVEFLREAGFDFADGMRVSYRNNVKMTEDGRDIKLSQRRLATAGSISSSLSGDERADAIKSRNELKSKQDDDSNDADLTQAEVLRHGLRGPMLLIYTIAADPELAADENEVVEDEIAEGRQRLVQLREAPALVLATPGLSKQETLEDFESNGTKFGVKYVVNSVFARYELGLDAWSDEDEDEGRP